MFEVIYTSPESSVVEQAYFESAEDYLNGERAIQSTRF